MKHTGVSNGQLEAEGHTLVEQYMGKGAYQQRSSMELALDILEEGFGDLYEEIFFGHPTFRRSVKNLMVLSADMEEEGRFKKQLHIIFDSIEHQGGDGCLSRERKEASNGISFILATVGHYCQSYDLFLRGNELNFQLYAGTVETWQTEIIRVFKEQILPTIDAVESILPSEKYLKKRALHNMRLWDDSGRGNEAARMLSQAKVEIPLDTIEDQNQLDYLIAENANMLESLLKEVAGSHNTGSLISDHQFVDNVIGGTPFGEIKLAIEMKPVNGCTQPRTELAPTAVTELRSFVAAIAAGYETNDFHNFQHASHVAHLSNLLVHSLEGNMEGTSGIVHDPFIRFSIVLSALVHDIGHTGLPNGRLAQENPNLATKYRNQSIAEQNSIDVAWDIRFSNLHDAIFGELFAANKKRLRQLVVNSVMATDIFDQDLRALQELRWDKSSSCENCKSTLVMEQILQASDVVHTMQKWEIYREWNQCLFAEMYRAFLEGRADKDQCESWFQRELWFFDNWVLPWAQNLRDSGVFTSISEHLIEQARSNRKQWELEGKRICCDMQLRHLGASLASVSLSGTTVGSEASSSAKNILTTTVVEEIESLSKIMKRYERKMESACGNLVAITSNSKEEEVLASTNGTTTHSWPDVREHFRQQDWCNQILQQHLNDGDDEMSALTFSSRVNPSVWAV